MKINIREANKSDVSEIFNLINELAHYEKSEDKVLITISDLERDGFGENPLFWVLVAEVDKKIVGMAFYYIRYSTWSGKCFYLEDFFVKIKYRRSGVGSLLFEECIRITKKINANSLVWQVLNWNTVAINFYNKYNAELKNNWTNGRLYKEQINGLHEGGCDILFIETVFDTLNAKAALMAVDNYFEENNVSIPVMLSGTITDKSGRTLSGQTVNAFLISISHFPLLSVGFNCALGTKDLKPYMKRLSDSTDFYTSSHPNAGLPNAFGEYDQSPENMVEQMKEYLDENLVNIIGGCCGTTYEHIELLSRVVKKYKPRKLPNV